MHQGKVNGYFCQGFNPLLAFPNREKITQSLSKLKWLVTMDPLDTETSRFWENHGVYNDVDTASIQTEVIQLPTTCFAEEEGSLTNSGTLAAVALAGRHAAGRGASMTTGSWAGSSSACASFIARKAARSRIRFSISPGTIRTRTNPSRPSSRKRYNGRALADLHDPTDKTKVLVPAGKQLLNFSQLRDDGTTTCGCWIYSGCLQRGGQQHGPSRQHR